MAKRLLPRAYDELVGMSEVVMTSELDGRLCALEKLGMRREDHLCDHVLIRGAWQSSLLYAAIAPQRV